MFVTIFYGILHTDNGELEYCLAGHNPPYILSRNEGVRCLDSPSSIIVGAFEDSDFETGRTILKPGDCVFLFTDGVTEAENVPGNFFSEERLVGLLEQLKGNSTEEIVSTVLSEVRRFTSNALPSDDITELALRYIGEI